MEFSQPGWRLEVAEEANTIRFPCWGRHMVADCQHTCHDFSIRISSRKDGQDSTYTKLHAIKVEVKILHCRGESYRYKVWVNRKHLMCLRTCGSSSPGIGPLCSLGWNWSWWLEWCERKILLAGWWLEAGAGAVWEKNIIRLKATGAAEQSEYRMYPWSIRSDQIRSWYALSSEKRPRDRTGNFLVGKSYRTTITESLFAMAPLEHSSLPDKEIM